MSSATPMGTVGRDGPDAPQQFAFAVVVAARDHRAVQVQQDPSQPRHRIDDAAGDVLEGDVLDRPARPGTAAIGRTISAPAFSASSMKAASAEPVPRVGRNGASPSSGAGRPSPARSGPIGVGTGEKVFVSCFIWAMTSLMQTPEQGMWIVAQAGPVCT
jgi:hypothetical protein